MKIKLIATSVFILLVGIFFIYNKAGGQCVIFRQGCCSHHGGVCGCDKETNHQKCCDDTLSPSCLCGQ